MAGLLESGQLAAQAVDSEERRKQNELKAIKLKLEQAGGRRQLLERELQVISTEAAELSNQLIDLAQQIQSREAQISESELRIVTLGEEESDLQADLKRRRQALSHLLAGLQQLERNPPPPIATKPDDAVEAIRGAMLFATIVPQLRAQSAALVRALTRIERLRARIRNEQQDYRTQIARLKTDQAQMNVLHERKLALAERTGSNLEKEHQRNAELAQSAHSLQSLLVALKKARLQRQEQERLRTQEEARLAQEEREKRDAEKRRLAALRAAPRMVLSKSKGRLAYPAQGLKIGTFGDDNKLGGIQQGLSIATRKNAQVTVPIDGIVEFAGPFRSYGNLIIIDAKEGYHVLLAGLETLTVETGHAVRAGEPVGTMGENSARGTLIGEDVEFARPILYVEFRKNGKAINPTSWWIGNRKEARR